jgi:hypothetical protein
VSTAPVTSCSSTGLDSTRQAPDRRSANAPVARARDVAWASAAGPRTSRRVERAPSSPAARWRLGGEGPLVSPATRRGVCRCVAVAITPDRLPCDCDRRWGRGRVRAGVGAGMTWRHWRGKREPQMVSWPCSSALTAPAVERDGRSLTSRYRLGLILGCLAILVAVDVPQAQADSSQDSKTIGFLEGAFDITATNAELTQMLDSPGLGPSIEGDAECAYYGANALSPGLAEEDVLSELAQDSQTVITADRSPRRSPRISSASSLVARRSTLSLMSTVSLRTSALIWTCWSRPSVRRTPRTITSPSSPSTTVPGLRKAATRTPPNRRFSWMWAARRSPPTPPRIVASRWIRCSASTSTPAPA